MRRTGTPEEPPLRTNGWGIDLSYQDAFRKWHEPPQETIDAILRGMGADATALGPLDSRSVMVVKSGEQRELPAPATIVLETGDLVEVSRRLPSHLPPGYHQLAFEHSDTTARLIVSPGKCWLPEPLQTWGWAVQLYAARSRRSWGIGDFAGLDSLAAWSREDLGAGMMLVNPLDAVNPTTPQQSSPYYPTTRRFFNPLWLHIEWIPGAADIAQIEEIARRAVDLNSNRLIDRDKVFELKMRALELLWLRFHGDPSFDGFCRDQAPDLDTFATFCALAERYKSGWRNWPAQYRHPNASAVTEFARENETRVRFYKWLQWLLDAQRARCSGHLALMQDLPIGVDPDGADAWAWQDILAKDVAVGAPPDEFNTQGQNWALPPFIPHKLRHAAYEPFIQTIRAAFRNAGGLRIDHVMGLFRLFWIPNGMPAAQGTYVRYNPDEMLAIVALESERAKAYVVGEDLGTVEEDARRKLADHRVMSYRLLWFEEDSPARYPREALAAVTTHDLPTIAGLWTGSDLEKQRDLHLNPNEESTAEIRSRLISLTGIDPNSPIRDVIATTYGLLSTAPSRLLAAALEDAAMVQERPNMPATTPDQHPNWSLALPFPIEDLMASNLPGRIARALKRQGDISEGLTAAGNR